MSIAPNDDQELIIVARAVRTRGLKGEIVAELLTDFPERFDSLSELISVSPSGERKVIRLVDHWFQNDRVILRFADCDTPECAKMLVGFKFAVPEASRVVLPESEYYDWELEGCSVETVSGQGVGVVRSVLKTGAAPVLVISREVGPEAMVPLAEGIVEKISLEQRLIVIDPPEGLLEL